MRRFCRIAAILLPVLAVAACYQATGSNTGKAMVTLANKSEKELKEMSAAERRELLVNLFGEKFYLLDPKIEASVNFSALIAFVEQIDPNWKTSIIMEKSPKLQEYLNNVTAIYAEAVDGRKKALEARFGEWFQYLSPEQQRNLIWDDAQFERAMTDDSFAIGQVTQADAYWRNLNATTRQNDYAKGKISAIFNLMRRNDGQVLLPPGGSARTGS